MLKVESPRGRALWLLLLGACGTSAVTDSRAPSPLAGVEAELRAITPAEEGRFVATIRSGARLSFDAAGARLGEGGPRIQLAAWGRGSLTPLLSAAPQLGQCTPERDASGACLRRLEVEQGPVLSWWRGLGFAVEQGWTLRERAPGDGPLSLELAVDGASVDTNGQVAWIVPGAGEVWRVEGLLTVDALGAPLPSWFERSDAGLTVRVDDTGAVYPLTVDPLYTTAGTTLSGQSISSAFGYSVHGAGDVNGDGYDDVIVGAPTWSNNIGRVYVFQGGPGGVSSTAAVTLTGLGSNYYFGVAVTGDGDLDADGFDDVAIGASGASSNTGKVYVYLGSATGISSTVAQTMIGTATNAYFGNALAIDDFNGDGHDDLAVGAYGVSSNTGSVTIYPGASSGASTAPSHTLVGASSAHQFGRAISSAGDVNGDGYADLVVGAPSYLSETGAAYVFHGSSNGLSTVAARTLIGVTTSNFYGWTVSGGGDFNGDGFDDIAVGAYGYSSSLGRVEVYNGGNGGIQQTSNTVINGSSLSGEFGRSVAVAGDIDGDGYDDLVVSTDTYLSNTGSLDFFLGDAAGLSSSSGGQVTGASALDFFGCSVAAAGDVDDDGYDDVIVGARGTSGATGSAYILHGYADEDADGYAAIDDCDDQNSQIHPGAVEVCDGAQTDEDCNGLADDDDSGVTGTSSFWTDADNDGYGDNNSAISACLAPSGTVSRDGDCNDSDASIHTGATEICDPNNVDENCNRRADDADTSVDTSTMTTWYLDSDQDGFGAGVATLLCDAPAGTVSIDGDCDDTRLDVNPDAVEVCDPLDTDEDCNGSADDDDLGVDQSTFNTFYADSDSDGYGDPRVITLACDELAGVVADNQDCDDSRAEISPAATEVCDPDNTDEDCNGSADDADDDVDPTTFSPWHNDRDNDGYGDPSAYIKNCDGSSGTVSDGADCDDSDAAIHPGAAEDCSVDIDFNCDGSVGYADADADGYPACLECDDSDAAIHPDVAEICDGLDNNCDGLVDDEDPALSDGASWYPDGDGDGFGAPDAEAVVACVAPAQHVADHTDCDDDDPAVYPGAPPTDDGVPRDCTSPWKVQQLAGGCSGCSGAGSSGGLALMFGAVALFLGRRRR